MKQLFSNIKGDAFGGITAGVVALPLALAFGVSSGLGPSAGLYGAIFISFFAALFGGTNTQISGHYLHKSRDTKCANHIDFRTLRTLITLSSRH